MRSAHIAHVDVDEPLCDVHVDARYSHVLLVVHAGGAVVGQILLEARPKISAEDQWTAIALQLGSVVWRQRLRRALHEATPPGNGAAAPRPAPGVSVIVCTRDRPGQLRTCLESLAALRTAPREIVVVDNSPGDEATRAVCSGFPVRYLREPRPGQTRARNLGIVQSSGAVVAFTDDDCVVDPGWLDDLGTAFADPLVMAVTGYIGPLELENEAQFLFELHGGFERHPEPRVFDGTVSPLRAAAIAGAGANMLLRREAFDRCGLFPEDIGPGTPTRGAEDKYVFYRLLAAGYRIRYEPARLVWHRHRSDWTSLRRALEGYGVAEFAYSTRCLVRHRELDALAIWRFWLRHYRTEATRTIRRRPRRIPLALTASEVAGAVRGPWSNVQAARLQRGVAPIEPAPASATEPQPRVEVGGEVPELSVAVASRNRCAMLQRVLEALGRQDYPAERFEVVLVLDGSSDASAAMARALETPYALRVLEQSNRGVGATRNHGAREAAHPIVVFLDDDIVPLPGFLAEHAAAHRDGDPRHLALGYYPPVVEGDDLWGITVRAWWEDHFRRKAEPGHQWTFVDIVDGNASLPKSLLLDAGGYDETFTGRRQDWELGIRLLRDGVRATHHPRAKGLHHLDVSFATGVRNARQEGCDDVRLGLKHPGAKPLLPLVRLARLLDRRPRTAGPALLGLAGIEPLTPAAFAALDVLQAARRRRRWRQLANRLLLRAYALGVADALPDPGDLRAFLAPVARWEATTTVSLSLDRPEPLELPVNAGMLDVAIGHGGRALGGVRVTQPGGQFDWQAFTEGAVDQIGEPARLALALAGLDERGSNGVGPASP
jgi:glycosyltransferase involved in cell wall biosynthesis